MLEQATNRNQNNKEGNKNKKHKKGNKDSNKSWRYSDSIMKDGKRKRARGEPRVYMFESRQAEEETRVIPQSGPARQSYS